MEGYKPKGKGMKWVFLFVLTGTVDAVQFIIDLTGVGIAVSEAIDVVMAPLLLGLLVVFRIPIFTNPARLASILGIGGLDALTGGIAPFWVVDVWYIRRSVKREDAEIEAALLAEEEAAAGPLYDDGVRRPDAPDQPLYADGVHQPDLEETEEEMGEEEEEVASEEGEEFPLTA